MALNFSCNRVSSAALDSLAEATAAEKKEVFVLVNFYVC